MRLAIAVLVIALFGLLGACSDSVYESEKEEELEEEPWIFHDIDFECSVGSDPVRCELAQECLRWASLPEGGPNEIHLVNRCNAPLFFGTDFERLYDAGATLFFDIRIGERAVMATLPSYYFSCPLSQESCPRILELAAGAAIYMIGPRLCGDAIKICDGGEVGHDTIDDDDLLDISLFLPLPSYTWDGAVHFKGCPGLCAEDRECGDAPEVLISRHVLRYTRAQMHAEGDPCPRAP